MVKRSPEAESAPVLAAALSLLRFIRSRRRDSVAPTPFSARSTGDTSMTRLTRTLATLLATVLPCATPALAVTIANGPYYATPSWDQTLPASSRFVVLANFNNEAVLDRETGLVWQRTVPFIELGSAADAARFCLNQATGGRFGWRLPSAPELASLIDKTAMAPQPALPTGHPFIGVTTLSATPFGDTPTAYYTTDPAGAMVTFAVPPHIVESGSLFLLWCVRGPASP